MATVSSAEAVAVIMAADAAAMTTVVSGSSSCCAAVAAGAITTADVAVDAITAAIPADADVFSGQACLKQETSVYLTPPLPCPQAHTEAESPGSGNA